MTKQYANDNIFKESEDEVLNKKFFFLWFLSVGLFVIPMISMCYFVQISTIPRSISILAITAAIVAFYLYCNKKNMLPEGYTTIQALFFYLKCKKNGIPSSKNFHTKTDAIRKIAKKYDFAKNFSDEELLQLFNTGKKIYKEIK